MGIPKPEAIEKIKGKGIDAELTDGIIIFKNMTSDQAKTIVDGIGYKASWGVCYE